MAENPAISIIIPLHNKGPFINETLESVVSQDLMNWEAIVVENRSTDAGPECAARWADLDQRIRLLVAPPSVSGPGGARNFGLKEATGDWILFLDADDLLEKNYLSSMLRRAEEVPDAVIVASRWIERPADLAESGEAVVKLPMGWGTGAVGLEDGAIAFTCWAVHAAIVKRRWLVDRSWPEELDGYLAEDTAFWFRAVHGARVAYSNAIGAVYRTQTENCRTNFSSRAWFEGNHRAALANLDYLHGLGKELGSAQIETLFRHYEKLYERALQDGDLVVAKEALLLADSWLANLGQESGNQRVSIRLRRVFGIPIFSRLKFMRQFFLFRFGSGDSRS